MSINYLIATQITVIYFNILSQRSLLKMHVETYEILFLSYFITFFC